MRQSLKEGKVIIVNQDLLLVSLKRENEMGRGLLPEKLGMIIIDEAHNLESKARTLYEIIIILK
jgi:ATP-dependent DNA helicase DinG